MATKIRNLKKTNNARKSLNRQLERAETSRNISEKEAIKVYRTETSLGNYVKCIKCKANLIKSSTVIVDEEDEEFSYLKESPELRRMSKFSMCVNCSKNQVEEGVGGDLAGIDPAFDYGSFIKSHSVVGGKIYSPFVVEDQEALPLNESSGSQSSQNDEQIGGVSFKTTVMFPTNLGCLLPDNDKVKPRSSDVSHTIYKCQEVSLNDIGILYFNQVSKYRAALQSSKIFTGEIGDHGNKTLSNLMAVSDEFKIRGSDKWVEHQSSNLEKRFKQMGQTAFRVEVEIPLDNKETFATNLLIEGFCITVSFEGNDCNDIETKYWVHLDHTSSSLCPTNCEKVLLSNYLQTRDVDQEQTKFISSYLASIFTKIQSFVKNIIKCPSSQIFSEEFEFTMTFDSKGVGQIVGFIWPEASIEFSEAESLESFFGVSMDTAKESYLHYVANVVTCSSNESELRRFGLNKTEASMVIDLVKEHQIQQIKPEFPSMKTMFKHVPELKATRNIDESESLRVEIMRMLKDKLNGDEDEIFEISTEDWLQEISTWLIEFEDNEDNEKIIFSLNSKNFVFTQDKKMLEMIVDFDDSFKGIYHYAISCVNDELETKNIILKRSCLIDSFTQPYNPFILQAVMSPIALTPVYSYSSTTSLKRCEDLLSEDSVSPPIVATHKQISLNEAFSLSDARKFRDILSSPVIYCNTNPDAKETFLKVQAQTEQTYTVEGEHGFFEMCYNVVSRHNLRMNGDNLLLAESACHYEFVGNEESQRLFSVYSTKLDQIIDTEAETVVGGTKMPEFILCQNRQVLKMRKRKKILSYPDYEVCSDKFKYTKILLFYPLAPGTEVEKNDLDRLYYETNDDQPRDKFNQRLTIIENFERKFYRRLLSSR